MEVIFCGWSLFGYFFVAGRQGFHTNAYRLIGEVDEFPFGDLIESDMEDRILSKYEVEEYMQLWNELFLGLYRSIRYTHAFNGLAQEGTLEFISSVTFQTVPDEALKASALIYFPSLMGHYGSHSPVTPMQSVRRRVDG